jgi:hypothetical protein
VHPKTPTIPITLKKKLLLQIKNDKTDKIKQHLPSSLGSVARQSGTGMAFSMGICRFETILQDTDKGGVPLCSE